MVDHERYCKRIAAYRKMAEDGADAAMPLAITTAQDRLAVCEYLYESECYGRDVLQSATVRTAIEDCQRAIEEAAGKLGLQVCEMESA